MLSFSIFLSNGYPWLGFYASIETCCSVDESKAKPFVFSMVKDLNWDRVMRKSLRIGRIGLTRRVFERFWFQLAWRMFQPFESFRVSFFQVRLSRKFPTFRLFSIHAWTRFDMRPNALCIALNPTATPCPLVLPFTWRTRVVLPRRSCDASPFPPRPRMGVSSWMGLDGHVHRGRLS